MDLKMDRILLLVKKKGLCRRESPTPGWRGKYWKSPQIYDLWRGQIAKFPLQTWWEVYFFSLSQQRCRGVPSTFLRVEGTLICKQTWRGHLGGTHFALGGIFLVFVPPNWGGNGQLWEGMRDRFSGTIRRRGMPTIPVLFHR